MAVAALLMAGLALGMLLAVSLPGVIGLWMGYAWYVRSKVVGGTDTVDPDCATSGLAKVRGTAKPDDDAGTVESPLTGTPSLIYEFEIKGYNPGVESDSPDWFTQEDERVERTFRLEGTVEDPIVEVDGDFDLMLEGSYNTTVEGYHDAPTEIQRYVDDHHDELLDYPKTRFIERRLEPGEEATVVGHVTRESPGPGERATTRIGKRQVSGLQRWLGQTLIVSDQPEMDMAGQLGTWAKVFFIAGGVWLFGTLGVFGSILLGNLL